MAQTLLVEFSLPMVFPLAQKRRNAEKRIRYVDKISGNKQNTKIRVISVVHLKWDAIGFSVGSNQIKPVSPNATNLIIHAPSLDCIMTLSILMTTFRLIDIHLRNCEKICSVQIVLTHLFLEEKILYYENNRLSIDVRHTWCVEIAVFSNVAKQIYGSMDLI